MRFLCFPFALLAVHALADPLPPVTIRGRTINDWCYQLQGKDGKPLDLEEIGASKFDLAVIDYSRDGSGEGEFSANEIAALKNSAGGAKTVLAYLSIGEAEDYRFYWDHTWTNPRGKLTPQAPPWLARQNANWRGNFKTRYWDPAWQAILFGNSANGPGKSYLDRIIDAGFDGVYLDIIDAFEFFGPNGNNERPTAASEMAALVKAMSNYARSVRGRTDFIVIPQNGTELAHELEGADFKIYLSAISGIATEDTFFYGGKENNNRWNPQHRTIDNLSMFTTNGYPVLAIDYVTSWPKVKRFYQTCVEHGYVPYTSVRPLNALKQNPAFPAD